MVIYTEYLFISEKYTVTEYSYNGNITVTKKVKITMTNIIYQNKKSNIYD